MITSGAWYNFPIYKLLLVTSSYIIPVFFADAKNFE